MSEDSDPPPPQTDSKAGRNKRRDLAATAWNNIGVGYVLAALVQPVLTTGEQERGFGLVDGLTSAILIFIALGCFWIAQRIAKRLED